MPRPSETDVLRPARTLTHAPHVVFAGGGTGGHLFAGLAVAEQLTRAAPGIRISFHGTGSAFEQDHVARAGFAYERIPSHASPRSPIAAVRCLVTVGGGYARACRLLKQTSASLIVGLGGYASGPTVSAAIRLGLPLMLLEQNIIPGRATRWFAPWADAICVPCQATASALAPASAHLQQRIHPTGTPIRASVAQLAAHPGHTATDARARLLVLGGSRGARSLNGVVPRAVAQIAAAANWQITHQTGNDGLAATRDEYARFGIAAHVVPFIYDMPSVLARSDLAVCRAGGMTLAELAAAGVPAILLPYPHAAANHQRRNADYFVEQGAALTLDERESASDELLVERLAAQLERLANDRQTRRWMSQRMAQLARPAAAETIGRLILNLVGRDELTLSGETSRGAPQSRVA